MAERPEVDRWDRWSRTYDRGPLQRLFFRPLYARLRATIAARPGERVLDVGSGTGTLVSQFVAAGANALGADASLGMARVANGKERGRFVVAAAERLPFRDAWFDAATTSMSMHHWTAAEQGLAELGRVVRPGGRVVVADVERRGFGGIMAALLSMVSRDHARYLRRHEVTAALASAGFLPRGDRRYRRRVMLVLAQRR